MFQFSRIPALALWALGCFQISCSLIATAAETKPIDFNRDIRPILSDKCFACHGFDKGHRQADLRLDVAEGAFDNTRSSIAITPGDISKSEVWSRITTTDPDAIMPPPDSHKELTGCRARTHQTLDRRRCAVRKALVL
jgi:hypothetical protein